MTKTDTCIMIGLITFAVAFVGMEHYFNCWEDELNERNIAIDSYCNKVHTCEQELHTEKSHKYCKDDILHQLEKDDCYLEELKCQKAQQDYSCGYDQYNHSAYLKYQTNDCEQLAEHCRDVKRWRNI